MSRSSMAVRFPDGTVKYGIYNGTSDVANADLHDTQNEAWEAEGCFFDLTPVGEEEDVVIFSAYGGGFYWPSKATRNRITGPTDLDDFSHLTTDGAPEWVVWR